MTLSTPGKIIAGLALVALTAAGCTTSGFRQGDEATLTMLTHYGSEPHRSSLQELVDEWNSRNPDTQVETIAVAFEDLLQTITVRQTARQSPDIVQGYSLWGGQFNESEVLAPPPTDVVNDVTTNYSDAATGSVTVDDKVLGYPSEVQTYALYYNKRLLSEAGVDTPPRTWDELEEAAAKTVQTDASGNLEVAGFGLETGADSAVVHPFLALTQAAGGAQLNESGDAAAFDSEAGHAALEFQKRLVDKKYTTPSAEVFQQFQNERVAMAINAGWWIGSLQATMGDGYEDIGVVPVPGPVAGDRGSVGYGFFTGVTSQSQRSDEAWEFLRWLNAEQAADGELTRMGQLQSSFGTLPGRITDSEALLAQADDPNYQPFHDALEYALPEANPAGAQQMKTDLQNQIEGVWTGDVSVAEALDNAARATNATLDSH